MQRAPCLCIWGISYKANCCFQQQWTFLLTVRANCRNGNMCVCVCARTVSAASLSQVKQLSQTTGDNTDLSSVSISDKLRQFVSNFCLYKDKRSFGPPAILNHITYALFIFPHIIETRLSRSNHKILHFSVIFWGKKRHHMSSPTSYFLTLVKRG